MDGVTKFGRSNNALRRITRECILPAHTCRQNPQWLPSNLIVLVHHEEIRWSPVRLQCLLSMVYSPLQFLHRDQNFPERGVNHSLPRVQTCHSCYRFLIVEDVPAIVPWSTSHLRWSSRTQRTYFSIILRTLLRCLNVVLAHSTWASLALTTARSIPSGVAGLTRPSTLPVAGQ